MTHIEALKLHRPRKCGSIALARSLCYQINGAADVSDDMDGGGYGSVDIAEILSAEVLRLQKALAQPVQELYNELLFAVGKKYPNETRHQTALRYIQQAEICAVEQGKAAHNIGDKT